MDIHHLKEFVVLAEYLNFSKASEELYVSQPVLSKHIASLERELELPLFIRNSRNVALTEWGREYLSLAKSIVAAYEKSEKQRRNYIEDRVSTLSIGLIENSQVFDLDKNLIEFHRMYPHIKIRTQEDTEKNLWKMLDKGSLNLITTAVSPEEFSDEEFVAVYRGSVEACISVNNPLAKKERISISEMHDLNIYFPPRDSSLSIMLDSLFKEEGLASNNINYGNYYAEIRFAEADLGISLVPTNIIDKYDLGSIKRVPLVPPVNYIAGLKFTRERPLSEPEKLFIEYARDFASAFSGSSMITDQNR